MRLLGWIRRYGHLALSRGGGVLSLGAVWSIIYFARAPTVSNHVPNSLDWIGYAGTLLVLTLTVALVLVLPWVLHQVIEEEGFGSVWLILISSVVMLVFAGAWSDWIVSQVSPGSFSDHLTRVDALYLSAATLTTAGSNIHPLSSGSEALLTAQTLMNLLILGGSAVVVITRIETARTAGITRQSQGHETSRP